MATTTVEKFSKKLAEALKERYEQSRMIKHEGTQMILPTTMSIADAINTLTAFKKSMDETTEKKFVLECHPHDGLIAFYDSCSEAFGQVLGDKSIGFWGEVIPSQTLAIPVAYNETRNIPYGAIKIPGLPVSFEVGFRYGESNPVEGKVVVTCQYQRLYEPIVEDIERMTRDWLKTRSIFKAHAIDSRFEFLNIDAEPIIIYTESERKFLEANLFNVIKNITRVKKSKIPVKRTLLFTGPYGTGKTLTALIASKLCVQNGWTSITVKTGDSIANVLRFARKFEPALVFFEDVDTETSGDRTVSVNDVLNEIDGVLSKNADVITVLTTNHVDLISRAMLRPGRVSLFELGKLDADTIMRLVAAYGGEMIEGSLEPDVLFKAAEGYTSAFVATAVNFAKSYAIVGQEDGKKVSINQGDIVDALNGLRGQFEIMQSDQRIETPSLDKALSDNVLATVKEAVQPILDRIS